jgi:nucleoside-diphosphate-sugar epimerase
MLEAAGHPPIRRTVSPGLALAAGFVFETVHALAGRDGEPRLSRWIVRELTTSHWFDISAARRELDWAPRVSIDEGLRRLRDWVTDRAR